jgi:hypothetical protein
MVCFLSQYCDPASGYFLGHDVLRLAKGLHRCLRLLAGDVNAVRRLILPGRDVYAGPA